MALLLDRGAGVHCADGESRWTPLHRALYGTARGKLAVALLLLEHGAALEGRGYRDNEGNDPLELLSPSRFCRALSHIRVWAQTLTDPQLRRSDLSAFELESSSLSL